MHPFLKIQACTYSRLSQAQPRERCCIALGCVNDGSKGTVPEAMRYRLVSDQSDAQRRIFLLEVFVTTCRSSEAVYLCNACQMHSQRTEKRDGVHKDEELSKGELEDLASAEYILGRVIPRLPIASVLRIVDGLLAVLTKRESGIWQQWHVALTAFRASATSVENVQLALSLSPLPLGTAWTAALSTTRHSKVRGDRSRALVTLS